MNISLFVATLFIILTIVKAVEFNVINQAQNTPGGILFEKTIGKDAAKKTLHSSTEFIWNLFQEPTMEDRKNFTNVTLIIDPNYDGVAATWDNAIHFSDEYLSQIKRDFVSEFNGVIYHEMTHVWQWAAEDYETTPGGLIEGIADFVRLRANYAPSHWVKPGEGDKWDQGYDVTARFLDYLDREKKSGFVAEINKKMRFTYSDEYFVELLGKSVDELWKEYKNKYGH